MGCVTEFFTTPALNNRVTIGERLRVGIDTNQTYQCHAHRLNDIFWFTTPTGNEVIVLGILSAYESMHSDHILLSLTY